MCEVALHEEDWGGGCVSAFKWEGVSSAMLVCFGGLDAQLQCVIEESDI